MRSQVHYCNEINVAVQQMMQTMDSYKNENDAAQLVEQETSIMRNIIKISSNMDTFANCREYFIEFLIGINDYIVGRCMYNIEGERYWHFDRPLFT